VTYNGLDCSEGVKIKFGNLSVESEDDSDDKIQLYKIMERA
jgi:hypothetical protein